MTLVVFIEEGENISDPQVISTIMTTEESAVIDAAKIMPNPCALYYKGEQVIRLSAGRGPDRGYDNYVIE